MDEKRSQLIDYSQPDIDPSHDRAEREQTSPLPVQAHGRKMNSKARSSSDLSMAPPLRADRNRPPVGKGAQSWPGIQSSWARKYGVLIASALVLLIVLATLGMVLYNRFAVVSVTAFHVSPRQNVPQFIGGGGMVYARQQFNLTAPLPTRVIGVMVNVGDRVRVNQPLLKLDQTALNAQVKMAQENVAAAESYLYSVSNAFPYNPVTVAAAQQGLREARSKYEALRAQATSGIVTSPIPGVVTQLNSVAGEVYIPKVQVPLLTVVDPTVVTVHAKIPLSNLRHVSIGMNAQVTPPAMASLKLSGKVISIVPQADPQTDTFEVWVQVANDNLVLLPGMSAFVSIQGQTRAFVLPRLAVLNPDHGASVFLIRDGHAVLKEVQVVGRNETSIFVDAGLTAEDTIVLLPLDKIHNGQALKINKVQQ